MKFIKRILVLFVFLSVLVPCSALADRVGLKVQEVDGSPAVWATNLTLPNGTVSCTGTTCTYTPAGGSGDVTGVGDCASGACLDGSSDGGTYISLYDGTSSFMKMLAGVRTLTLSSGVASSEDLTITLGSNDNTVGVSSSTGVTTVDFGSIGLKAGTLVVGTTKLVSQADCTTITEGLCIDSDNNRIYRWNGSAVEEVSSSTSTVQLLVFDLTESVSTGDSKSKLIIPASLNGWNLTGALAYVDTVSSSGLPNIMIRNVTDTVDMLSTALTIDESANSSSTATTPVVIDTAHDDVATNDVIAVDVDAAGTGTKGLIVTLTFSRP